MTFDSEKFDILIEGKKFDEAKSMIQHAFTEGLTPSEEGALYTQLAIAKVKLSNAVNRRYKAVLESVVASLRDLKKAEVVHSDKAGLLRVRGDLAK